MATLEETTRHIFSFLSSALSDDAETRKQAEKNLRDAEERQDFFAALVQIATAPDEHASPNVRWLAAVCAKNAVPRSWRRQSRPNALTQEEREFVISELIRGLGEQHPFIATQISVWVATIARSDFPRHWLHVIPDICDRIKSEKILVLKHALSTLDMTLKRLESLRLRSDRVTLSRFGPPAFALLFNLFSANMDQLSPLADNPQQQSSSDSFNTVVLCMKSMRRILSYACPDLDALPSLPNLLYRLSHDRVFLCGSTGGTDVQRRLSLLAAKLIRTTHARRPIAFQPYLSSFLPIYFNLVTSYTVDVSDDRTCFHAAQFVRNSLTETQYRFNPKVVAHYRQSQAPPSELPPGNSPEGCRHIVLSFFNEERIKILVEAMVSKIFVLTKSELESWSTDPERLVREEEDGEWGIVILRKECETLFICLLIWNKDLLSSFIVNLLAAAPKDQPLVLDACYRAIGRTANDVWEAFEFDAWLKGPLGAILGATCSDLGERIIQARAAWLVGQFVERMKAESRVHAYPLLVRLMSNMEYDRVVVLTAAKSVQQLVDDIGFHSKDFERYLDVCVRSCISLIRRSESVETKMELVGTMVRLVSSCDVDVLSPVVEVIASAIPDMWEEVGKGRASEDGKERRNVHESVDNEYRESNNGEYILRAHIVTLVGHVVAKVGDVALRTDVMTKVIMTVVQMSVDTRVGGPGVMSTRADGCDLWLSVVNASAAYSDRLHDLFPIVEHVLGNDFDNIGVIFQIIRAYMLLGRDVFMRAYAEGVVKMVRMAILSVRDRGLLACGELLDSMLRAFPQDGVLVCGDVLHLIMEKVASETVSTVVMSSFVTVMCRAAMTNVTQLENVAFRGDSSVCLDLLDRMIECLEKMPNLPRRKLDVLALCGLCRRYCAVGEVQERIPEVLNCVVQVASEAESLSRKRQRQMERAGMEDRIVRTGEQEDTSPLWQVQGGVELHGAKRQRALESEDMVKAVKVEDGCKEMLTRLKAVGGEDAYTRVIAACDREVLSQLGQLLG